MRNMCREMVQIPEGIYEQTIQQVDQLVFTNHAVKRWNERIGPNSIWWELNELVTNLHMLGRIRFVEDLGIIDDDIVFCFTPDQDRPQTFVITTMIGRISLKPLVHEKEYIRNRYIYLDVPEEIIRTQQLPLLSEREQLQLKEIKEQIAFNQLSLSEQETLSENRQIEMNIQLEKGKRIKEREERKRERLIRKKENEQKYKEMIERVKQKKMKQRMNFKCSIFSSMVGRDISTMIQRPLEEEELQLS